MLPWDSKGDGLPGQDLASGGCHEDDQLLRRQLLDVEGIHAQHPGPKVALPGLPAKPLRHILRDKSTCDYAQGQVIMIIHSQVAVCDSVLEGTITWALPVWEPKRMSSGCLSEAVVDTM